MLDPISDSLITAVVRAVFGTPTRAGFSVGILGPVTALVLASFGSSIWLVLLVWMGTGLAAGALIAVRGRGREGLLRALIVPTAMLALVGLPGGASVAGSRGAIDAVVNILGPSR